MNLMVYKSNRSVIYCCIMFSDALEKGNTFVVLFLLLVIYIELTK